MLNEREEFLSYIKFPKYSSASASDARYLGRFTFDMFKDVTDVTESEIKDEKTVDIGYYLEYCGHRIIKNVYYNGYVHDDHDHVFCTTVDCKNQYTLPVNSIEFIIPHED